MKHFFLTAAMLCVGASIFAQDLPGFKTSNYNGVIGVYSNPANVAQNNYKWDIHLFSIGVGVGNNNASFSLKNLSDTDSLLNRMVGNPNKASNALLAADVRALSFMIGLNRKSGIAFTYRGRTMLNTTDLDGTFGKQIIDEGNNNSSFPYTISSDKDMRITANAWSEIGLTYGRVLLDKPNHFMKVGVSAKYLAGVANAYININKLKGTLAQDPSTEEVFLRNATGGLEIGTAGVSLDDFDLTQLTAFESTGFGIDLGFIYEFRPKGNTGKRNNYKLRLGVSLSDMGSIKYEKNQNNSGGYNMNIGSPGLNLKELGDQEIDNIKDYLDSKPQFFTPINSSGNTYNVSLPSMLNIDVDYKIMGGLYVNAAANVNMVSSTAAKVFNNRYYNSYTVTPRLESKSFGVFVPINQSDLSGLNAGVALKLGPLFIGSGSIITAALSESKQADFFFGLRFGSLAK